MIVNRSYNDVMGSVQYILQDEIDGITAVIDSLDTSADAVRIRMLQHARGYLYHSLARVTSIPESYDTADWNIITA